MFGVLRKFLLYACALPLAIYLPLILIESDIGEFIYWLLLLLIFFGAPWTVTWTNGWRTGLAMFVAVTTSMLISLTLLFNEHNLRTPARWIVHSSAYKMQVLAQPELATGRLRHMEWDGWGWGGNDTYVYLVYDPQDHLKAAVQDGKGMKAEGLCCEVSDIHRLEKQWYTVTFFTDENWADCDQKIMGAR